MLLASSATLSGKPPKLAMGDIPQFDSSYLAPKGICGVALITGASIFCDLPTFVIPLIYKS